MAKRFDGESGLPRPGNDNWLSDTKNNAELSLDELSKLSLSQAEADDKRNEKTQEEQKETQIGANNE